MGVRITEVKEVALYDSVTGRAFGPVFEDVDAAVSFINWLRGQGYEDARTMTVTQLEAEHKAWSEWNGDA